MSNSPTYRELEKLVSRLTKENEKLRQSVLPSICTKEHNLLLPDFLPQAIIDLIPQSIFWKDKELKYIGCNRVFAEKAGIAPPSKIAGLSDFDLPWTREEAEFYRKCDFEVMTKDEAQLGIIEPQRNSKGEMTWLNTNKIPIHNTSGKVVGILGTFEDITDRIHAEEELKNYKAITATTDDLLAIIDTEYAYKAVNVAYCSAHGVTRKEMTGRIVEDPARENIDPAGLEGALAGETSHYEGWEEFPQWGKRYVHTSLFPMFSENRETVIGLVLRKQDMTEHRRLESQLQQAQKMEAVGRLAGGIAHDFNNILSVINGYSDLCLTKLDDDNPHRIYIQSIKDSGLRASRLTQQLLGFSRKQIIKPKKIHLGKELQSILHMLDRLLGENIKIELKAPKALWDVSLDPSQLEQIVVNLAVNARDAMGEHGRLGIEISNSPHREARVNEHFVIPPGEYVSLAVTDNGSGMDAETQKNIFEPFFTTKDRSKGTGLGLSTVYGIVKQNNSFISVYSEINMGTTFRLYFPRCESGERQKENRLSDSADVLAGGRETILLVEDDAALRKLCVEMLTDLGYTILEASNGREAIETSSRFHGQIDVLLTDVIMPELSGPETAEILTGQMPHLQVIYMSGYTENAIVHHGVLDENINFIPKPIARTELITLLRKILD